MASQQAWHNDKSVKEHLADYHLRKAREPDYKHYKQLHDQIISKIRGQLQGDKKCLQLEYTGSAYEGVQVGSEVEFDVMVVMDGSGILAENAPGCPGYLELTAQDSFSWGKDEKYKRFISTNNKILPSKVTDMFHGTLTKVVEQLPHKVKLRKHGPAVQMDVYENDRYIYSVDIVPAFRIPGSKVLCVAKPFKTDSGAAGAAADMQTATGSLWRISKSMEEKEKMLKLDVNNGCRKQVLRILKTLVKNDVQFRSLTSYHMKTAVLHMSAKIPDWNPSNLVQRLIDVMVWIEEKLRAHNMPHFFLPGVNLLANMQHSALNNMADRMRKIHQKREVFLSTFKA